MITEIYEGIVDILRKNDEERIIPMKQLGNLPKFFEMNFGIPQDNIARKRVIKLEGCNNIILVLGDFSPKRLIADEKYDRTTMQYQDIIMYGGKLHSLVGINLPALQDGDITKQLFNIMRAVYYCVSFAIPTDLVQRSEKNNTYSAIDAYYYASAVLAIKLFDELYGDKAIDSATIADCLNIFYEDVDIPKESVKDIRRAIDAFGISMLIDYNLYTALPPYVYPHAKFLNLIIKDDADGGVEIDNTVEFEAKTDIVEVPKPPLTKLAHPFDFEEKRDTGDLPDDPDDDLISGEYDMTPGWEKAPFKEGEPLG